MTGGPFQSSRLARIAAPTPLMNIVRDINFGNAPAALTKARAALQGPDLDRLISFATLYLETLGRGAEAAAATLATAQSPSREDGTILRATVRFLADPISPAAAEALAAARPDALDAAEAALPLGDPMRLDLFRARRARGAAPLPEAAGLTEADLRRARLFAATRADAAPTPATGAETLLCARLAQSGGEDAQKRARAAVSALLAELETRRDTDRQAAIGALFVAVALAPLAVGTPEAPDVAGRLRAAVEPGIAALPRGSGSPSVLLQRAAAAFALLDAPAFEQEAADSALAEADATYGPHHSVAFAALRLASRAASRAGDGNRARAAANAALARAEDAVEPDANILAEIAARASAATDEAVERDRLLDCAIDWASRAVPLRRVVLAEVIEAAIVPGGGALRLRRLARRLADAPPDGWPAPERYVAALAGLEAVGATAAADALFALLLTPIMIAGADPSGSYRRLLLAALVDERRPECLLREAVEAVERARQDRPDSPDDEDAVAQAGFLLQLARAHMRLDRDGRAMAAIEAGLALTRAALRAAAR